VTDLLRGRAEAIFDGYRRAGVQAIGLSDNLYDDVRNDFGMAAWVVGLTAGAENADASLQQINAWYLMAEKAPGHLLSYSTWIHALPGYPVSPSHPAVRPDYFVYKDSAVSTIITGLSEVKSNTWDALGGAGRNGHVPLTSEVTLVLAAIRPADLKEDEDDIALGHFLRGQDKRNSHLIFAPIATTIDPQRPRCPIAVVSIHPLSDGPETLRALTAPIENQPLLSDGAGAVLYLPNGTPHPFPSHKEAPR
jgi:hypothetical protein